jgi:tRNA (mo5U34)-methyltransferase
VLRDAAYSLRAMTQDTNAIQAAIDSRPFWHHAIEVAPGIFTPGLQDTAAVLRQIALPEDLTGMRVLDLGARDGFFSFEAEKRGASEVVAVDYCSPTETGFATAAGLLGSKVKYVTANVYSVAPEQFGKFDLILFLGLLYHLRHPLLALDRMYDVANPGATILIESHIMDEGLADANGDFHQLAAFNPHLVDIPLVQYFPGDYLGADPTNQYGPNIAALRGWLRSAGFETTRTWHEGTRGGATAVQQELAAGNERAMDEANSVSLQTWTIFDAGETPTAQ